MAVKSAHVQNNFTAPSRHITRNPVSCHPGIFTVHSQLRKLHQTIGNRSVAGLFSGQSEILQCKPPGNKIKLDDFLKKFPKPNPDNLKTNIDRALRISEIAGKLSAAAEAIASKKQEDKPSQPGQARQLCINQWSTAGTVKWFIQHITPIIKSRKIAYRDSTGKLYDKHFHNIPLPIKGEKFSLMLVINDKPSGKTAGQFTAAGPSKGVIDIFTGPVLTKGQAPSSKKPLPNRTLSAAGLADTLYHEVLHLMTHLLRAYQNRKGANKLPGKDVLYPFKNISARVPGALKDLRAKLVIILKAVNQLRKKEKRPGLRRLKSKATAYSNKIFEEARIRSLEKLRKGSVSCLSDDSTVKSGPSQSADNDTLKYIKDSREYLFDEAQNMLKKADKKAVENTDTAAGAAYRYLMGTTGALLWDLVRQRK